jgi:adenylate kinase
VHCRLVLLGPPAAGKGTQAELLKERFGFQIPSVGAMLREEKAAGTPAGLRAAEFFERGLLVPDEVSTAVVASWLAQHDGPWIFDGYPRSLGQAVSFDEMLAKQDASVDCALLIEAAEPVIRDRVANRLVCSSCGAVLRAGLHVQLPSDPCPRCGGALTRRKDDNPEALADRLSEYHTKTEPVIAWYKERGILRTVDGNRPIETVFADISALLTPATA